MGRTGVLLQGYGGPATIADVAPFMRNLMGREPSPELIARIYGRPAPQFFGDLQTRSIVDALILDTYDPATGAWTASGAGSSAPLPLPQARGGMGKAVFDGGEFWVFGGETLDGPGATGKGVYDRVDIYDPAANAYVPDLAALGAPEAGVRLALYAWEPDRGALWVSVNERDTLGGHVDLSRAFFPDYSLVAR